ncbi:hypothetical protein BDR22DRAFT_398677 [Usnea florida]
MLSHPLDPIILEITNSLRKILSSPSKRFRLSCYPHSSTGCSPFVRIVSVRSLFCRYTGVRFAWCERKKSGAALPVRPCWYMWDEVIRRLERYRYCR